jgi:hypothetical protein
MHPCLFCRPVPHRCWQGGPASRGALRRPQAAPPAARRPRCCPAFNQHLAAACWLPRADSCWCQRVNASMLHCLCQRAPQAPVHRVAMSGPAAAAAALLPRPSSRARPLGTAARPSRSLLARPGLQQQAPRSAASPQPAAGTCWLSWSHDGGHTALLVTRMAPAAAVAAPAPATNAGGADTCTLHHMPLRPNEGGGSGLTLAPACMSHCALCSGCGVSGVHAHCHPDHHCPRAVGARLQTAHIPGVSCCVKRGRRRANLR